MEYLYDDGEYYYFMNTENFEQMHLMKDLLGDAHAYLIPQLQVTVEFYEGKPISVELPATVDMTVVETEPGLKGATVSNVTKPAKTRNRPGGAGAAVHHRRRKDPRQHFRRHVSGTGLNGSAEGGGQFVFLFGENGSQSSNQPVVARCASPRRVARRSRLSVAAAAHSSTSAR